MTYRQITSGERYILAALRKQGFNQSQIAEALGRHRSTIAANSAATAPDSVATTGPVKRRSGQAGGAPAPGATCASRP